MTAPADDRLDLAGGQIEAIVLAFAGQGPRRGLGSKTAGQETG